MTSKRYTEEFKIEAVKQVTERGYSVAEVAERLGVTTTHSLYAWMKRYGEPNPSQANKVDDQAEIAKLKAELRRVTEERDILKKAVYVANDHVLSTPLSVIIVQSFLSGLCVEYLKCTSVDFTRG
ncbi:UNVERIFIED_CONTAM: hypothetical protein GTU68_047315 [Idotea baltica]|nr:hypothetical protein [Idotea baltica]